MNDEFVEVTHEQWIAAAKKHGLKTEAGVVSDACTLLDKDGREAAVFGDDGSFGPMRYWLRKDLFP